MELLIKNIRQLLQVREENPKQVSGAAMAQLPMLTDAWLHIQEGKIAGYGPMTAMPQLECTVRDAAGRVVMPAFCDSHTHLVYAGSREQEFVDRIRGLSYEEIARRGGGILNSSVKLRQTSEDQLYNDAMHRIKEIMSLGTAAVEIKSGYGLDTESELKMLRVIRRIKETAPLTVKATFLGAHAVPPEYRGRQSEYVDLIVREMIPAVAAEGLADYVDVFCDQGFFTPEETAKILEAAAKVGMVPKIHANEMGYTGGIQAGVAYSALSVDHLEFTGDEEINHLKESDTMPTLLPGAAFFLGLPWPPARKMIESGLPIALASDYNPGSSPSGNMMMVLSLACICLKMLPSEAINAATINSAYAMGLSDTMGSISRGKPANILITKPVPSYEFLPYSYGSNLIESVIINGNYINSL
ncbi:MAG: imidazolonepropionase [Bacteroidales bacterium]|jgi:imidazolonepropionase|nr:imidazolonepropionase [Bacteroidales bacterium]MDD3811171.1 imidazolonepropionase [Bacteroidales bacterium]MDD3871524.1 imidazolonepropionase [Bacteroidales bacterium]